MLPALQRPRGAYPRIRGRHRDLGAFISDPCSKRRGAGLVVKLIEHQQALRAS